MQRTKIKVGEEYGVVARMTKRAKPLGPATVVELGATYKKMQGEWTRREVTHHDGIAVTFPFDVFRAYDEFKKCSQYPDNGRRIGYDRIKAGTKIVLTPKSFVGEWAPLAEMFERHARENAEAKASADAMGDRFEPFLAELTAKIEAIAPTARVHENTRQGTERKRTVHATFTLSASTIAHLLGVDIPRGEDE